MSADRFFDWFDGKVAEVRPEVRALTGSVGLKAWHTGGGCLAWGLETTDGRRAMIGAEDAEIDADPAAEEWGLTVEYLDDAGDYLGCINTADLLTLPRAIEAMRFILDKVPAKGPWREIMKEAAFNHDFDGLNDPA